MKRTILIIEDDIIFSRSISNWLKKKKCGDGMRDKTIHCTQETFIRGV